MEVCLKYVSPKMRRILRPAVRESHYSSKSLSFREYDNAYIVPFYEWRVSIGGVADESLQVVIDSSNDEWEEAPCPLMDEEPSIQRGTVIYIGVLLSVYGHTFTDNLRKIWFLQTEEGRRLLASGVRIVYTTDFNKPLSAYAQDFLRYAGCDIGSAWHIDRLTRFDKVILPDNSFFAGPIGRMFTDEYIGNFNRIFDALRLLPSTELDFRKIIC